MAVCQNCGYDKIPRDKLNCPKCGTRQLGPERRKDRTILLRDVQSSDANRMQTGPWDSIFGENWKTKEKGIALGSTNLLAGQRGCGKSTWLLQIADVVATPKEECLYISSEEPDEQIRSRADRLGIDLTQGRIRMLSLMSGEPADIEEELAIHKPRLLIFDSISALTENLQGQVQICMIIKKFCMRLMIPSIITSHINKGGDVGGLEALQHAVDSVITFFPDGETEDSPRVLHVQKNRNGIAYISYMLSMTVKGLVPLESETDG